MMEIEQATALVAWTIAAVVIVISLIEAKIKSKDDE